jgi:hypothetical protein
MLKAAYRIVTTILLVTFMLLLLPLNLRTSSTEQTGDN